MIFSAELFIASEEINLYDSSEKFWIIFESTEVDAIYHPFPSRNFDLEIKISTIVYYSKNLPKSNISTSQIFPIISIQTAHNESTGKPISHRLTTPYVFLLKKKKDLALIRAQSKIQVRIFFNRDHPGYAYGRLFASGPIFLNFREFNTRDRPRYISLNVN